MTTMTTTAYQTLAQIQSQVERIKFPSTAKEEDRCRWYDVNAAIKTVTEAEAMLGNAGLVAGTGTAGTGARLPVMVQSNCFDKGSLGNQLSNYFEARICAHLAGVHYLSVVHLAGEDAKQPHPFFAGLPTIVPHPSPAATADVAKSNTKKFCTCGSICHGGLHDTPAFPSPICAECVSSLWLAM